MPGACSCTQLLGCLPPTRLLGPPAHSPALAGHPAGSRPGGDGFEVLGELGAEVQQSDQWHPREIRETWLTVPKKARNADRCFLGQARVCMQKGRLQGENWEMSPGAISLFRPVFCQSERMGQKPGPATRDKSPNVPYLCFIICERDNNRTESCRFGEVAVRSSAWLIFLHSLLLVVSLFIIILNRNNTVTV